MKPIEANSLKKLCKLKRDNYPSKSEAWTILVHPRYITLFPPAKHRAAYIPIPKKQFNAIVKWYLKNQKSIESRN